MIGFSKRSNEAGINPLGSKIQVHFTQRSKLNSKVLVDRELKCSGPDYPPRFEGYIGVVGPSSQE